MQSLQSDQRPSRDPRLVSREQRSYGQPADVPRNFPRPACADCSQWRGRRARPCHGALGDARSAAVRRCTDHQYSQCWQPALARLWLGQQNRCIVPATSFCEYADTKPRKTPKWFALGQDRPLFAFAGLWTPRRGMRGPKSAPVDGQHELFGFLTTEANAVVAPIHPKAMPVILTTPEEVDLWLRADAPKALELQRPLPDDMMRIVASGEREDGPREDAALDRSREPMLPL